MLECLRIGESSSIPTQTTHGESPRSFRDLKRSIRMLKPSIIFIYETLCNASFDNRIKASLSDYFCFSVSCEGRSGGLLLLWDKLISLYIISYSFGYIDSIIKNQNFNGDSLVFMVILGCLLDIIPGIYLIVFILRFCFHG